MTRPSSTGTGRIGLDWAGHNRTEDSPIATQSAAAGECDRRRETGQTKTAAANRIDRYRETTDVACTIV